MGVSSVVLLARMVYICNMKFKENLSTHIFDVLFCAVLMPMLLFLGPPYYWLQEWPVFFVLVCVLYYGSYLSLRIINVPRLMMCRRYALLAATGAVLAGGVWAMCRYPLPKVDFYTPLMSEYHTQLRDYNVSVSLWMIFSLVVAYALTVSFIKELYGEQLKREQLKHQKKSAELAALRAQISPHFLFNTLNSLYGLVLGTSRKAEDALLKFTEILEYTYMTVGNETVRLEEEVRYISNYVDLQSLRLNEQTRVEWSYEVENGELRMPPMILLTFVENLFKYGTSPSRESTVHIHLRETGGVLEFGTCNKIMKHEQAFREQVPVGVSNCRARLESFSKGDYSLDIEEGEEYRLRLRLRLQKGMTQSIDQE